jgi:hypothetical protein
MTDQEIRELVRDALARRGVRVDLPLEQPAFAGMSLERRHASQTLLPIAVGADGDGLCLIEPAVRCNHCGYCASYGH